MPFVSRSGAQLRGSARATSVRSDGRESPSPGLDCECPPVGATQLVREGSPPPDLRLPPAKLSRKSNWVARGRIRRFESYMPTRRSRRCGIAHAPAAIVVSNCSSSSSVVVRCRRSRSSSTINTVRRFDRPCPMIGLPFVGVQAVHERREPFGERRWQNLVEGSSQRSRERQRELC